MVAAPCLVCGHCEKCPWHRVGVCRFAHDGKPPVLEEVEDLRHVMRFLAATVMWLSGTDVPQVVEVAEIGAPLRIGPCTVLVELITDGIAEQMVDCTPHDVGTGVTDLKGQKAEVVATGVTDLEAREGNAGRVVPAWKDLRKWNRLLRCRELLGAQ